MPSAAGLRPPRMHEDWVSLGFGQRPPPEAALGDGFAIAGSKYGINRPIGISKNERTINFDSLIGRNLRDQFIP